MVASRIIACLDVRNGRVVKGTKFENLRDQGDPVELAKRYNDEGIDELVFLDITATNELRKTARTWVEQVARELTIPFCVGGGVSSAEDVHALLRQGADKVAINSAAVKTPSLLAECADQFGAQCIVCAVDARYDSALGAHRVYIHAGKTPTDLHVVDWCHTVAKGGAGEILLTSMDRDGTLEGYDLALLAALQDLPIPLIASGGAGTREHFDEALRKGASAVLAASLFHERKLEVSQLKAYLTACGHEIRNTHVD